MCRCCCYCCCCAALQVISSADIALYGGLTALASFDRPELRTQVQQAAAAKGRSKAGIAMSAAGAVALAPGLDINALPLCFFCADEALSIAQRPLLCVGECSDRLQLRR
jgi:hypothetical protein